MKIKKNLTPESSIKASLFPDLKSRPPGSLYLAHLQFPFRIYDKADSLKYEGYKSKEKVFRQNYNVILIPQAITGDTVTVDMFLSYKKLDGVPMQRWTPIKKRFKICKNIPVRIDLPKENWCVSALLYGEKYDIYGYSHYERFVYEYLTLTLHSIFHEGN
jgi:hypothetical protein